MDYSTEAPYNQDIVLLHLVSELKMVDSVYFYFYYFLDLELRFRVWYDIIYNCYKILHIYSMSYDTVTSHYHKIIYYIEYCKRFQNNNVILHIPLE